MPEYPFAEMTQDRKGNKEVRLLLDRGKFVRYQYRDPDTGEIVEKGKISIILQNRQGKEEHLYIIPLQPKKSLVIWPNSEEKIRRVWNSDLGARGRTV